jgi:hypothetical protein
MVQMRPLPPDLERLGEVLTDATTGAVAARRHRRDLGRRLVICLAAGTLVFAATTPSRLGLDRAPVGELFAFAPSDVDANLLGGGCDGAHGAGGRYFQLPQGCVIVPRQPQAR